MRERPRGQPGPEACGSFVAEDQRGQRVAPRALQPFGAGQRGRQDLHRALARHVAMALAHLDRAPGQSVEQGRRAWIRRRPARCIDRGAAAAGCDQARTDTRDLGLRGAGEHHAERVQEHELGVLTNSGGDGVPRRRGYEMRELLDLFAHRGFSVVVERSGAGMIRGLGRVTTAKARGADDVPERQMPRSRASSGSVASTCRAISSVSATDR